MSTIEYLSLFKKAQNNGKYHMFSFDIKGSKQMKLEDLINAEDNLKKIILTIYDCLKEFEKENKIKILLDNDLLKDELSMKEEPYFFGDSACLSIYRNSIDSSVIYALFNYYKKEYGFKYDVHIADGYYETVKWSEGDKKFARSYCFDILSNFHKEEFQKEYKKIK